MAKVQEIPNKLYFRIGEVSDIVGVKPYVLRYWESEFPDIKPSKSKSGQRLYKRRDVELLVGIKRLLYDERFTIDGARKRLKDVSKIEEPAPKQLEVFAQKGKAVQERPKKAEAVLSEKKVLVKIKKDLESLLQVIRE